MKVLIAPNSFKHCLSALDAGRAMERGVRRAFPVRDGPDQRIGDSRPRAAIRVIPLADGGDGLVSVLQRRLRGRLCRARVTDPLGRPIEAHWLKAGDMAVIELAEASGLRRLNGPREYAPGRTTTAGTGLLVREAMDQGCTTIVIGLGGSATVDAGCGLAAALGFRFLDRAGRVIPGGGGALHRLCRIDVSRADPRLKRIRFIGLCDVKNSLLGAEGAARVFGPQKGATPREVLVLERNLRHWARVVKADLGLDVRALEGGGAAGGVGAGLAAFLGASLESGAEWVARQCGLEKAVRWADLVLTGEGCLDGQTAFGKVPACVGRMARAAHKPVLALAGRLKTGPASLRGIGLTRCRQVSPPGLPLDDCLRDARTYLEAAAAKEVVRLWKDRGRL